MLIKSRELIRGDTIIEVLFAITVFSLLAVGAITVMNQGTATAQKALEITLVRQQIDAQAESIRYIQNTAAKQLAAGTASSKEITDWRAMTQLVSQGGKAVEPERISQFTTTNEGECGAIPDNAFITNAHTGELTTQKPSAIGADGVPYAHVLYDDENISQFQGASGLWIEAARNGVGADSVDFHIRACWHAPGSGPATTLGTIVRLYAPSN